MAWSQPFLRTNRAQRWPNQLIIQAKINIFYPKLWDLFFRYTHLIYSIYMSKDYVSDVCVYLCICIRKLLKRILIVYEKKYPLRINVTLPKEKILMALTDVAQWFGHCTPNQKVAGSIPSQGTCLEYGPGPQLGPCKRQPMDVSLTYQCFSPSPPPSIPLSLTVCK